MITRSHLKELTNIRLKEARALLSKQLYSGAYYLSGYTIECALKACIAKKTRKSEFPDKQVVANSYTHNLGTLIGVAGLKTQLDGKLNSDKSFAVNWTLVKEWSEESRYVTYKRKEAEDLLLAITDSSNGILLWIQQYW